MYMNYATLAIPSLNYGHTVQMLGLWKKQRPQSPLPSFIKTLVHSWNFAPSLSPSLAVTLIFTLSLSHSCSYVEIYCPSFHSLLICFRLPCKSCWGQSWLKTASMEFGIKGWSSLYYITKCYIWYCYIPIYAMVWQDLIATQAGQPINKLLSESAISVCQHCDESVFFLGTRGHLV